MERHNVLIVDDDRSFRLALAGAIRSSDIAVLEAGTCTEALEACASRRVDVVLLDHKLPDCDGVGLCQRILRHNEGTKIIAVTAYPELSHAVSALRAGAFDYVSKPIDVEALLHAVSRALRTVDLEGAAAAHEYETCRARNGHLFPDGDAGLREVRGLADMAAAGDAPVLITGETGTGKTMLARYIHARHPGPEAPFVALNTAALPKELVESELFGHERGAFTGADRQRKGLFEMAHGGTLFLDEIGSLAVELQAKLLSVLEDGAVRRIGGDAVHPVRVRIISATNSDVLAAVRRREFREDLYYRLNVLRIHLPPLRERRRDIGPLCRRILSDLSGGRDAAVPEDEVRRLEAYDWPGNVRELRNVLQRALILQAGPELRPSALLERPRQALQVDAPSDRPALGSLVALEEIERHHVLTVLERLGHNLARTSRVLGLSESTLRRKLQAWGARR